MKLISACLLGIRCTWGGHNKYKNDRAIELSRVETLIPICPEQLGGLATLEHLKKSKAAQERMSLMANARF